MYPYIYLYKEVKQKLKIKGKLGYSKSCCRNPIRNNKHIFGLHKQEIQPKHLKRKITVSKIHAKKRKGQKEAFLYMLN